MVRTVDGRVKVFHMPVEDVSVRAKVTVTDGPAPPVLTLTWRLVSKGNSRGVRQEEINYLSVAEAKAMLKCLKAAVRYAEDVEDGEAAVVFVPGDGDGDGETD